MPAETFIGRARERLSSIVEERTGYTFVPGERLELLESSDRERRTLQRELDLLAYTALDYVGGQPQELKAVERRKLAQKALVVWMRDPLAGAAIDLMNDFVFGRGIPKPKANDKLVQEVIDEAWDDPDNQEVLTTVDAQTRMGTDLSLRANVFLQVFDDGEDGKVKLSWLKHDLVEGTTRDPEVPQRILFFIANAEPYQDWDYERDQPIVQLSANQQLPKVYYPHWRNVELVEEEAGRGLRPMPNMPPESKIGDGKIFHIAINRTTDMTLGHPPMDRLLRWFNAYNRFMDARVDMMEASAAFIMKRKVKGTPTQLGKIATQALSRRSALGAAASPETNFQEGPNPASVISENDTVDHEPFKLDSGAANAAQDAQMLRASVSAGTRFPQSMFGDASNSNLATATSLELPVLKAVESRQEKFEAAIRFFVDRVIERAVETGRISKELADDERAELHAKDPRNRDGQAPAEQGEPVLGIGEAHEDAQADEAATERNLGYEFAMPSPLKRMMGDLITAVQTIATTFDPNNTNIELSRTLLAIALGEGLELEDPAGAVEKIFPEGYVDPAVEAAQQAAQMGGMGGPPMGQDPNAGEFGGADGQQHTGDNPYGAVTGSRPPEQSMGMTEAVLSGRSGQPIILRTRLEEQRVKDLPPEQRSKLALRTRKVEDDFDRVREMLTTAETEGG